MNTGEEEKELQKENEKKHLASLVGRKSDDYDVLKTKENESK
jgi:hypothetical protein